MYRMNIEGHKKRLKEHINFLEIAIERGVKESQSTIGFHTSQGAVEMLSIHLHKLNLISAGKQINHLWFRSQKTINKKLPQDFPHKKQIINMISKIEDKRDSLIYGAPKSEEEIEKVVLLFQKLRKLIEQELEK